MSALIWGNDDTRLIHAASTLCGAPAWFRVAGRAYDKDMKGDRVEIVVDVGDGTKTYEIVATKAGRRVEISNVRGTVEVSEITRTGVEVRSGRFMAARVVAVIEYPADDQESTGPKRPKKAKNQSSLI